MRPTRGAAVALGALVAVLGLPGAASAAQHAVSIRDNFFSPREIRIDPGDTVVWTNNGQQTHSVTSDKRGEFNSDVRRGRSFSHTFEKEGFYYYHCRFHGGKGQVGQWGLVIVGNPPPPGAGKKRTRIVVPDDHKTIRRAVNHARPHSTIVVKPGVYRESVVVRTPDLVIKGVDRFRTVLHGGNTRTNGITVDGANEVSLRNLTVRNYTGAGIYVDNSVGYSIAGVDAIKNRTFGIRVLDSYYGVVKNSFAWGSGDSAIQVANCLACSALIDNVTARYSFMGYSGPNATGVVVRNSRFRTNGAGIVPSSASSEELAPNRGTLIYGNVVASNNYDSVPAAGISETIGIPFGTGIWLLGVRNNMVWNNTVSNHDRYGVLITEALAGDLAPLNNTVIANVIRSAAVYALAWDGAGSDNCFSDNDFEGATGPPDIESVYGCDDRPFDGDSFAPVRDEVAAAVAAGPDRAQRAPPEPTRPKCQRGAPGCKR